MCAILKEILLLLILLQYQNNRSVPYDRGVEQCVRSSTDVKDLTFSSETNDSIRVN